MQVDTERVDGGYGWMVVAAAFVCNAVNFGILYSFTVFFPSILDAFNQGRGVTAIVPSVAAAIMLTSGAIVGKFADRFGFQRVIATGALLVSAGLLLASFSTNIWQIFLTFGLLFGVGIGSAFLPANSAVGQWFQKKRGLATGIAVAGSGVGSVIFGPVSEWLIANYDWRYALRLYSVIILAALLGVAFFVRQRSERSVGGIFKAITSDRTFRILYLGAFIASFGYWVPFFHIVPFALDHGIDTAQAAVLVSVLGAFNILGRIILGGAADKFGTRRLFQAALGFMGVTVLAWPLAQSFGTLVIFVACYGFFAGSFISLIFALTADYFGIQRLAGITGLLNTSPALGTLMGAPIAGFLFDRNDSYTLAIVLAALVMLVGTAVAMALPPIEAELA